MRTRRRPNSRLAAAKVRGTAVRAALAGKPAPKPRAFRLRSGGTLLAAASVGAAVAILFDPRQGRRRRSVMRDRAAATLRRTYRRIEKVSRYTKGRAAGVRYRIAHRGPDDTMPNDPTLKHRIESEYLPSLKFDTSRVNLNVANGIAVLRGELDQPEEIRQAEEAVAKAPGIRGLESYLHLRNTAAPNKQDALRIRSEAHGAVLH